MPAWRGQRRSRPMRASKPIRWSPRAVRGRGSTPPTCSRSSTGACSWITCNVRRACSRCRKPCWVNIVQASRVGGRERNEDRVGHWSAAQATLLAVADGLGGHAHGDVAAQIAIDILGGAFAAQAQPKLADASQFLVQAIETAHAAILREADLRDYADSPRTLIAACVVQAGLAYWPHVGDCRCCLLSLCRRVLRSRGCHEE